MAGKIGKSVKLFSYARTLQSKSDYALKMNRLSNQIFGEVYRPTSEKSVNLVEKYSKPPNEEREFYVQYYPAVEETTELMRVLRDYGLYRDEYEDFKEEMERQRALRGKIKVRPKWKDGVKPEKVVDIRYDD
ncbi:28S ribosomal protein S33, mitochondrial [Eurytemora carolleeae]|uniref:28S ribosomal protein S33, mitochondrial n=1 Tax=Eurytemora carolleeae TaxID=1294199 RepID=UPI000C76D81D|nr:28S ribosomal protein S33, mitochondrial [Eurytemora carolleeae]|eukprot:XP_023325669.1 28S ribosomal protein S33, mitochondrial-like [Eurytemora affinis]